MKHLCKTTCQSRQISAALVLTSIISFGVCTSLVKAADTSIKPIQILSSELPPPLTGKAIFRAIATGGSLGQTTETTLLSNGHLIRTIIAPNGTASTHHMKCISSEQMRQFKQLLEQQPLAPFNGLSYPATSDAADYITITLSSREGTIRYANFQQDNLPQELQQVIQAWNRLTSRK